MLFQDLDDGLLLHTMIEYSFVHNHA